MTFSTLRRALQCHKHARYARANPASASWTESAEFWEQQAGYWKRETWSDRGGDPALDFDGPLMGKGRV